MSDEQRVRTMAGWIGVEISRSRVRTVGKAGYGLYRVRGWERYVDQDSVAGQWSEDRWRPSEWTAYAFTLRAVELAVAHAISRGTPAGPQELHVLAPHATASVTVPTRWTSAYRGRRDLAGRAGAEVPPGDSLGEQPHDGVRCHAEGRPHLGPCVDLGACGNGGKAWPFRAGPDTGAAECGCPNRVDGTAPVLHRCLRCGFEGGRESVHGRCAGCGDTPERRRRARNATFQAEHLRAREWGLRQRHAAKLGRAGGSEHSGGELGAQRGPERVDDVEAAYDEAVTIQAIARELAASGRIPERTAARVVIGALSAVDPLRSRGYSERNERGRHGDQDT